jgi:Ca2+-transporting ATPase
VIIGVFASGHNVKCDESGATGKSHGDRIVLRGQGFLKEGFGKYIVIAVGQKSFNGRIMVGVPSALSTLF